MKKAEDSHFMSFGSPIRFIGIAVRTLALATVAGGCAGALRDGTDLGNAPVEFKQEMKTAEVPIADTTTASRPADPNAGASPAPIPGSPQVIQAKVTEKLEPAVKKGKAGKAATIPAEPGALPGWSPKDWPFGIGEKFEMALRYGPIEGGLATFEVKEPKTLNGETVLHYQGRVKSSKMLELFYKVDDTIDSFVGIADHLPRRQEIKQIESAHWGRRIVLFDKAGMARFYSNTTKKSGEMIEIKREDAVAPFAQDVFGALYFYRFVESLDKLNFPIHDRWKNWQNEFRFLGREKVRVPLGVMSTLRFKMRPRVSGHLEPKGDVDIWVSDDSRRLLVQFKANIKVGSITGELKSYTEGRKPAIEPPRMRTPTSL